MLAEGLLYYNIFSPKIMAMNFLKKNYGEVGGLAKVYIGKRGVWLMSINIYKGEEGSKSPKSCLRRKWMTPNTKLPKG